MKNVCLLRLLLFIAVYFFLCFATSEIQEVRIKNSERFSRTYPVLGLKPLHVVFEGFNVKSLRCVIENQISVFLPGNHTLVNYNNGTSVLKTPGLKRNSKTRFECEIQIPDNVWTLITNVGFGIRTVSETFLFSSASRYFIEERGSLIKSGGLSLSANNKIPRKFHESDRILSAVYGKRLQFELKDTPEYEGITEYVCNEGEIVDLTCSKCLNYGSLKLRYYDQNGTKMVETDEVSFEDPLNFRLLVRAENDRSYVDCIHVTDEGDEGYNRREFMYRVIFIIRDKSPKNNVFIITMNGVELISSGYQSLYEDGVNGTIYTYHYKFAYSDTLNITCENNDKSIVSDIETSLSPKPLVANAFKSAESIGFIQKKSLYNLNGIWYLVKTTNLHGAILKFRLKDFNEKKYYDANITFYIDDHDGQAILGLPRSNIIYQYSKCATEWFIHYQYAVDEVLNLTCISKPNFFLKWIYGENKLKSEVLGNKNYDYISRSFHIHNKTNETITCETTGVGARTRRITIVVHMIPEIPTLENKNGLKVNSDTDISENIQERQSNALEIVGIAVGSILAVISAYCCWRLKKRTQVTQKKQVSRTAGEDYNRVNVLTDQTESPEYECMEYNDNTHPDALNADQESSTPIRAPAPPPRSALPSKNTRFEIPPRGCSSHREMEQCRCSTNQRSDLQCTHIENEYDYVYGVKKKCPCVAPLNRGARKPLQRNDGAVVPHQVPTHQ